MNYDAVFISDVHLGTSRCNTEKFLSFLRKIKTKKLVIIGDFLDIHCLEKYKTNWTRQHTDCIHGIFRFIKSGCEVIYIPGNHDATLRQYCDFRYNNFLLTEEYVHIDSRGNSYLCVHGDAHSQYSSGSWRQLLFNKGYEKITPLNNFLKKTFDFSLINYLQNTKRGKNYIDRYERDLVNYCKTKDQEISGIICGHIHYSNIRKIDNLLYLCCGDFCDTCSCITERNGIYEAHQF